MTKIIVSVGLHPATLISAFSKPVTDPNWRNQSSPGAIAIRENRWWTDYTNSSSNFMTGDTWAQWCKYVMIIGPPRPRSRHELSGLDEEYLTEEEDQFHFYPWLKTWKHTSLRRRSIE